MRADGSPHVVPVWFVLDGDGAMVLNVDGGSIKAKALRRDPRVSLCVDDETPPYSFERSGRRQKPTSGSRPTGPSASAQLTNCASSSPTWSFTKA